MNFFADVRCRSLGAVCNDGEPRFWRPQNSSACASEVITNEIIRIIECGVLHWRNRIGRDGLAAERDFLWGEAYQRYLDMRAADPDGELFLDLDGAVADERDDLAERSRKRTVPEEIAVVVQRWLDTPFRACDVMLDPGI